MCSRKEPLPARKPRFVEPARSHHHPTRLGISSRLMDDVVSLFIENLRRYQAASL